MEARSFAAFLCRLGIKNIRRVLTMAKNAMQNIWAEKKKERERLAKKREKKKATGVQTKKDETTQTEEPKS
jgi:hypothetical protein